MDDSPRTALADLLIQRGWHMATAESCTGGLVAAYLTELAGASAWFDHSIVSYSYEAKARLLAVSPELLATEGAVSAACVRQMVEGLLRAPGIDAGLAISGIAGPEGGTVDKPVGTVWFAFAKKDAPVKTVCQRFSGDREAIRQKSCRYAIAAIYDYLLNENQHA
jgi:nicotinamide-nucleotide amidase